MRILLSSVGRRGYLVRYFKEAVGPHGEVWGGDCSQTTSAFRDCDNSVLLPEVTQEGYVEELLELCRHRGIDILVPLIDPELEVLASERERFAEAGVMAVVSPPRTIEVAYDKLLTYQFGKENGIPVPATTTSLVEAQEALAEGELDWPLVVKPRKGSASREISYCHNMEELQAAFHSCPLPIIQEFLRGDEYGYDIFGDQRYRPISVFCKLKLAMRAGETDKAVSTDDPEMLALGMKIAKSLELFGPLDGDAIVGPDGPKLLELNPRFGGGYPCAHLCGADFPNKLIAMWQGRELQPDEQTSQVSVYMFKQDEIISRNQEAIDSISSSKVPTVTKRLNVLFTSAGRRVSLMRAFRRAANDLGVRLDLHAVDCQPLAPAMQVADEATLVPPVTNEDYCEALVDYCQQHQIDALIPLIDPELLPLSEAAEQFRDIGTRVIISTPEVVRLCVDKVCTERFLKDNGFRTPRIFGEDEFREAGLPLFMKPQDGSSSIHAEKISTQEALAFYHATRPQCIVQEFIEGVEYTVDVFADFDGRPLCAVPRRRHEVRGGEVSKGQVVMHRNMIRENCRVVETLGGCQGMITIQCFLTPDDEIVFIEINPRFGGGVPLSIQAGADTPRWLIELLIGRQPTVALDRLADRLYMLRYDGEIFVHPDRLLRA